MLLDPERSMEIQRTSAPTSSWPSTSASSMARSGATSRARSRARRRWAKRCRDFAQGLSSSSRPSRHRPRQRAPGRRYHLTVHSRLRRREVLRAGAQRHRREWLLEGGQADHRLEGSVHELAEVARVAHAWHDGTALAVLSRCSPRASRCTPSRTGTSASFGTTTSKPGEPSTVLAHLDHGRRRSPGGDLHGLVDLGKDVGMAPSARPTHDPDPVEIDRAVVTRFIHRGDRGCQGRAGPTVAPSAARRGGSPSRGTGRRGSVHEAAGGEVLHSSLVSAGSSSYWPKALGRPAFG